MRIQDITTLLERIAPLSLQEAYDNAGLLCGNKEWDCTGVLTTLDVTEDIVDEAMSLGCNMIVAHHPIIFKGLRKLTGENYVERTIIKALKNDVAIYAIHTNLDNIKEGVNKKIAEKLGLTNLQILQPRESMLKKLVTFVPQKEAEEVKNALFSAGAGNLGKYSECSFSTEGTGSFKPGEGAQPFIGKLNERHLEKELKIEVIFPAHLQQKIVAALISAHPYEEAAYDIISLGNFLSDVGSGMTGDTVPIESTAFLEKIKHKFDLKFLKHTALVKNTITRVAVCGGAGIFLLKAAITAGADVFVTSDIKYHEYFDAEGKIILVDIGHFESEQFTTELLFDILQQNFPNFAVLKSVRNTNPVHYF